MTTIREAQKKREGANYATERGWTGLMDAIEKGQTERAIQLIKDGANVGALTYVDYHYDSSEKKFLRDEWYHFSGEKINARDVAKKFGNWKVVHAIDANQPNSNGWTPLMGAIENNDVEYVKELLEDGACTSATTWAKYTYNPKRRDFYRDDKHGTQMTPMKVALTKGNRDIINLLVQYDAPIDEKSIYGWTALHHAAMNGDTDTIKLLLKNNVDLNAKETVMGQTALLRAAFYGETEAVKLLAEKGADLNVQDKEGCTALHYALVSGKADMVQSLIDKGANVKLKNKDGKNALEILEENKSKYESSQYKQLHSLLSFKTKNKRTAQATSEETKALAGLEGQEKVSTEDDKDISVSVMRKNGDTRMA